MEEMQSRRVLVLVNLKSRNMGGFKSEGMVSRPGAMLALVGKLQIERSLRGMSISARDS